MAGAPRAQRRGPHGHAPPLDRPAPQPRSSLLASLIIPAFLTHTVLEWMDGKYQLLHEQLPSRQRLFNDIRTLTSYLGFETWETLMDFMLESFEPVPAKPETG